MTTYVTCNLILLTTQIVLALKNQNQDSFYLMKLWVWKEF